MKTITIYEIKDVLDGQAAQGLTLASIQQALAAIHAQGELAMTKFNDATTGIQTSIDAMNENLVNLNTEIDADRVAFEALASTNAAQASMIKELLDAGGTPEQLEKLAALKASLDEQDATSDAALARLKAAREANTTTPPSA